MWRCDEKEAGHLSAAYTLVHVCLLCQSPPSNTAHLTAIFLSTSVLPFLCDGPSLYIFYSNFSHLYVLCSPLIYCWTGLLKDPEAFHSVKDRTTAPVSEKHPETQKCHPVCACTLHTKSRQRSEKLPDRNG